MRKLIGYEFTTDGKTWFFLDDRTIDGAVRRAKRMLMDGEQVMEIRSIWK